MKVYLLPVITSLYFLFFLECKTISHHDHVPKEWTIHSSGIGDIELNKIIPGTILNRNLSFKDNYFSTYIADGRIFEGFKINKPPILVGIANGPMNNWENKYGSSRSDIDLSSEAAKAAKNGAIVDMIIIDSKKYKTKKMIGVGSSYNSLKKAYPDLKKNKVPPTLGGDLCSAHTSKLKNVYFYFRNCHTADKNGKIVRIMIFEQ